MILHCDFEELRALASGMEHALQAGGGGGVAAPPEVLADVEALQARLTGDIAVSSYAEQQGLERALELVRDLLHERMDDVILSEYVGSEAAIVAYFDYAHVLNVLDRVMLMGDEMAALIELMTGEQPSFQTAREIVFPD